MIKKKLMKINRLFAVHIKLNNKNNSCLNICTSRLLNHSLFYIKIELMDIFYRQTVSLLQSFEISYSSTFTKYAAATLRSSSITRRRAWLLR